MSRKKKNHQEQRIDEVSPLAIALSAQVLRSIQEILISNKPLEECTADEVEAVIMAMLCTAAHIEAYCLLSLPDHYAKSVRAFLEAFSNRIQSEKNRALTMLDAHGNIMELKPSTAPTPLNPSPTHTKGGDDA